MPTIGCTARAALETQRPPPHNPHVHLPRRIGRSKDQTVKHAVMALTMSAGLLWATGCGMPGRWVVHRTEPETARGSFEEGEITLRPDHTYVAEAQYPGAKVTREGRWEYADGKLTFTGDDGRQRVYEAELLDFGKRLKIVTVVQGADVVAILTRQ